MPALIKIHLLIKNTKSCIFEEQSEKVAFFLQHFSWNVVIRITPKSLP